MGGRVDPLAALVNVREHFHGAHDGVGGGERVGGVVDDMAKGAANVAIAFREEAGGVCMAIDHAAADFVLIGEAADVFPIHEALVDFVLKLMTADAAVRLMKFEAREAAGTWGRGVMRRRFSGDARSQFSSAGRRFFSSQRIPRGGTSGIRRGRRDFDYCGRGGGVEGEAACSGRGVGDACCGWGDGGGDGGGVGLGGRGAVGLGGRGWSVGGGLGVGAAGCCGFGGGCIVVLGEEAEHFLADPGIDGGDFFCGLD